MPGRVVTAVLNPAALASVNSRDARGDPVAIGIGEMQHRPPQRVLDPRAAGRASRTRPLASDCLARLQWVMVCAPIVTSGSSANGFNSSQDMTELTRDRGFLDAMARA